MTLDLNLFGYRFYLSLAEVKPTKPEDPPPTQLGTPMVVQAGRVGFYQQRGNETPVGKKEKS